MGYKFSNEFRREAVELYESGLSAAAVFDRLEAAHGVRPSRATLTLWVAAHRHGVDQDLVDDAERVRECAAEVIGRVVASRVVLGATISKVAAEYGCGTTAVSRWVDSFGPKTPLDPSVSFNDVVLATMERVNEHRKNIRAQNAARQQAAQAPKLRPVDEWLPGSTPDVNNLPDDPAALKRIIAAQVERDMVKDALLQAAFEQRAGGEAGKDLAPAGQPDLTVRTAAVEILVHAGGVSVRKACRLVGLSKSTFFDRRDQLRRHALRQKRRAELAREITDIVEASGCSYGYRRVHHALAKRGIVVSEKVVNALMGECGLRPKGKRIRRHSSYAGENEHKPENLLLIDPDAQPEQVMYPDGVSTYFKTNALAFDLHHDFYADKPWQKLGTDVTEVNCVDGKLFISPVVDFYDGYIPVVAMSPTPDTGLVMDMMDQLKAHLPEGARPIIHSDRGMLYRTHRWVGTITDSSHDTTTCRLCETGQFCPNKWLLIPSLSRKGTSGDNARVEGFFGTMKQECIYGRPETELMTRAEMIRYINRYVDFYNHERLKSTLTEGYTTIAQYRQALSV